MIIGISNVSIKNRERSSDSCEDCGIIIVVRHAIVHERTYSREKN
jgi:hypothetical protein